MVTDLLPSQITAFIGQMLPQRSEFLQKIEKECREEWIPLIDPAVAQFLQVLLHLRQPLEVLEIGTGIGYSSIIMAQAAVSSLQRITTIEIDPSRYARACQNIEQAGVSSLVKPLCGDANEIIPTLTGPFDFIFIDAAKGQYPEFFTKIWPFLPAGGVIVLDNIFLNGWVITGTWPERRKKTMVVRVRELLKSLKGNPELLTAVIPVGDGLLVSVRRKNEYEKG